ncbi:protein WVD2-like 7 [Phalaenopsis equestris]|uniref:protein WVD2-like 7 n=1 Tax=Phalaenopsis equestris TaxID=78828 RepID=UPI0009E58CFB|nr:protein WVD2-like 7 [Phalaenopsis equestris]
MASDVQQNYYEWKHEQKGSQEPSISQMMDHGSISFGRFAFEPLSWEKRSVFTYNERQEELEKVKSPGLVAKKKAYFEEYYKKIRALKALQNQQTELSLEYGADGSISSQTGDEDEPPLLSSRPNEMPESISKAPLEDLTGPGSVENCAAEEATGPHRSHSEMEKEENHNNFVKIENSNPEFVVRRLSTESSEEIEQNEKSHGANLSNENDMCLKMEPGLTRPFVCSTDPTVLNAVVEKNKLMVHKPKEDSSSVPMSKEHAASNRYLSKSVKKSVPECKKSSRPSNRVHKIEKADTEIPSSKKGSNKARSSDKSSSVASHRSPTEVQNKVSILRSHSKVTNKSSSRKLNPDGKLKLQGESRETTKRNTVKNGALQSKSAGHEEFKNLESRCSTVEGRAATEQLKTRSINLCSRNIHDPNRVISYLPGSLSAGDKSKMANASTTRKYEVKASKISTVRPSGNNKADATKKQMTTVEKLERPNGVSKSFIGGMPLVVKKSRKENPRWR